VMSLTGICDVMGKIGALIRTCWSVEGTVDRLSWLEKGRKLPVLVITTLSCKRGKRLLFNVREWFKPVFVTSFEDQVDRQTNEMSACSPWPPAANSSMSRQAAIPSLVLTLPKSVGIMRSKMTEKKQKM
jgi:hypothetical protein